MKHFERKILWSDIWVKLVNLIEEYGKIADHVL